MNTLYEVNWHYKEEVFSHCTVTPITVLRRSVLPGCAAESITARGVDGRKFEGSPRDFFETEKAAWDDVVATLKETMDSTDTAISKLTVENFHIHRFLCSLRGES